MTQQAVMFYPVQGDRLTRGFWTWAGWVWAAASVLFHTTLSLPLQWVSVADSNTNATNATIVRNTGEAVTRYFDLTIGRTYMGFNPIVPSQYVPTYFFFSSKLTGPVFQGMVQDFGITFMSCAGLSESKLFMVMPGKFSNTDYRRITMQYDIATDKYSSTSVAEIPSPFKVEGMTAASGINTLFFMLKTQDS